MSSQPIKGHPWWLRQSRIHLPCGRPGFDPWIEKIPWRRALKPFYTQEAFLCGTSLLKHWSNPLQTSHLSFLPLYNQGSKHNFALTIYSRLKSGHVALMDNPYIWRDSKKSIPSPEWSWPRFRILQTFHKLWFQTRSYLGPQDNGSHKRDRN